MSAETTPAPKSTASDSRADASIASTIGCGRPPASAGSSATSTLEAPCPPSVPAHESSTPEPATKAVTSPPSDAALAMTPRLCGENSPSSWCA
jgi:hypothetical protein